MPRDASLNEAQRRAVEHGDGPLLTLAGPGTGKTRVIACRIAHLIESGRVPARNILAITFTNKAARELEERVLDLLGQSVGGDAWIATFHHACARILRESGSELGMSDDFGILDADAQDALFADSLRFAQLEADPVALNRMRHAVSARKTSLEPLDEIAFEEEDEDTQDEAYVEAFRAAVERYEARLADVNALDFDDLLAHAVEGLRESPETLEKYRAQFQHVLVDEYQDINGTQYELLKMLCPPPGRITAVGDPNQSVYRWRGSSPEWMRRFQEEFQPAAIALDVHYRSTRTILSAATGLIRHNAPQTALRTDNAVGNPVRIYFTRSEPEAAFVARRIVQRLNREGHVPYRDIAVFYRNHRSAERIEDALRRFGIPTRRAQPSRELVNDDAGRVLAWLRYLCYGLGAHLADALMFPTQALDEWTRVWFQWRANREGRSFEALAVDPDENVPPLTRGALKRVIGRLTSARERLLGLRAPQALEAFFEELEALRSPFRPEELDESPAWSAFPQLTAAAELIGSALRRGESVSVEADGSLDSACAAAILRKTFGVYFGAEPAEDGVGAVHIRIGAPETSDTPDESSDESPSDSEAQSEAAESEYEEAERLVWIAPPEEAETRGLRLTAPEGAPLCAAWIAHRLGQRLLSLAEEAPRADAVVYDLETTGANPRRAEIIEFAGARVTDRPAAHLHLYIRPRARISRRSTQIHGIDADTVRGQPRIEERIGEIRDFFGDAILVGHNIAEFDNRFLEREMRKHLRETLNNPSYDTLQVARRLYPHVNHTLTSLTARFGIPYEDPHRANHDAQATAALFERLRREEADRRARSSLPELLPYLAAGAASRGALEAEPLAAAGHAAARWLKRVWEREETLQALPEALRVEAGRFFGRGAERSGAGDGRGPPLGAAARSFFAAGAAV